MHACWLGGVCVLRTAGSARDDANGGATIALWRLGACRCCCRLLP